MRTETALRRVERIQRALEARELRRVQAMTDEELRAEIARIEATLPPEELARLNALDLPGQIRALEESLGLSDRP
jgi:hypothetical protein